MHPQHVATDSISRAISRGFDRVQAERLAFVRWSMLEGYAQFSEYVTSDAPIVDGAPDGQTATSGSRREV